MTKISILCYQKNGGGCRNKVSPANNFICGAGHSGTVSSKLQKTIPVINLPKISLKREEDIAKDPTTSPELLAQMAGDADRDIRRAVASNSSTPPETLAQMAGDKSLSVRRAVAGNLSTSFGTYISLAQQDYPPYGFTKGKPIDELIEDVALVDQYPDMFGEAYLYRLLYSPIPEDETHPKRRALIGYVYTKFAEDDKTTSSNKQPYKNTISYLFPDDQEMAEMIGY